MREENEAISSITSELWKASRLKKYKIFLSHNFQFQFYTWPGVWGSCCWIPGYNFPTTVWRHPCVIPWPHTAFFTNAWPYISVNSVWDNSASPLVCSWSCSRVTALRLPVSSWRPHGCYKSLVFFNCSNLLQVIFSFKSELTHHQATDQELINDAWWDTKCILK